MRFAVGAKYLSDKEAKKLHQQIRNAYRPEDFNDKKVLFVDEEIASGGTLQQTSNLFQKVFSKMKVQLGALSEYWPAERVAERVLDIKPPSGSYYSRFFSTKKYSPRNLAQIIHWSKSGHRRTEIEEGDDQIVARRQNMPQKAKWTYRMGLVGKYETLDTKSLGDIDERIKFASLGGGAKPQTEDVQRLIKIREAYEKLL